LNRKGITKKHSVGTEVRTWTRRVGSGRGALAALSGVVWRQQWWQVERLRTMVALDG